MSQDPSELINAAEPLKVGDRVIVHITKGGNDYHIVGTIIPNQNGVHSPRNPAVALDQPLPAGLVVRTPDYILPGPENVTRLDAPDPAGGRRRRRSRKVRRRRRYTRRR
jgi:hypothetical protein